LKVLSFDAATKKTGWAFFKNKDLLVDHGLLRAEKDEMDYDVRIMQLYLQIKKLVQQFKPDYVVFENTPSQNNAELGRQLSRLHGCIMSLVFDSNGKMGFRTYMPTKWRSVIGTYGGNKHLNRVA
jgi:Holliday junction resolvasome RuvABC endonuclease subunit